MGRKLVAKDFDIAAPKGANQVKARVIGVIENQAPTKALERQLKVSQGLVDMDRAQDVCQIALVERHRGHGPGDQRLRLGLRLQHRLRGGEHGRP